MKGTMRIKAPILALAVCAGQIPLTQTAWAYGHDNDAGAAVAAGVLGGVLGGLIASGGAVPVYGAAPVVVQRYSPPVVVEERYVAPPVVYREEGPGWHHGHHWGRHGWDRVHWEGRRGWDRDGDRDWH